MDNRTITQVRNNETKLINEIKILQTQLKKQQEIIDKIFNYLEEHYGYNIYKGTINDTDIKELYKILEDKEVKK